MNENGRIKETVHGRKRAFRAFLFTELVSEIKGSGMHNESEGISNIEDKDAVVRNCEMPVG